MQNRNCKICYTTNTFNHHRRRIPPCKPSSFMIPYLATPKRSPSPSPPGLRTAHETQCLRAGSVSVAQIRAADIVVMGSPTRSFRATPATHSVLEAIPSAALQGKKVAAFDTRLLMTGVKGLLFRKIIDKGGYAAPLIASELAKQSRYPGTARRRFLRQRRRGSAGELANWNAPWIGGRSWYDRTGTRPGSATGTAFTAP